MTESRMSPTVDRGARGVFRGAGMMLKRELGKVEGTEFEERYFNMRMFEAIEVRASDQGTSEVRNRGVDRTEVSGYIWVPKPKTDRVPHFYAAELGIYHELISEDDDRSTEISDKYGIKVVSVLDFGLLQTERTVSRKLITPSEEAVLPTKQSVEVARTDPVGSGFEVGDFLRLAITSAALALHDRSAHIAELQDDFPALEIKR